MSANTLSILTPSVNNLSVRIFVRAAGLEFEEVDVWGKKGTPEFLAKDPADLTPLLEEDGLPKRSLWESCAMATPLRPSLNRSRPTAPSSSMASSSSAAPRPRSPTFAWPQRSSSSG
jgi:glutathione S-transferase